MSHPLGKSRQILSASACSSDPWPLRLRGNLQLTLITACCLGGCSPRPTVFDLPSEPRILSFRTYEGSGQVVHPDVLRLEGPRRRDFWLALTPYPWADEKLENPSIYRSPDGIEWSEPAPGVNPVAARPPFDHNCDPDLAWQDEELHLFWLETQRRGYRPDNLHFQELRVSRSRDGIEWSESEPVVRWDLDTDPLYLSPAVVRGPEGWRVYLVNAAGAEIVWIPAGGLDRFGPVQGRLPLDIEGLRPWHVDVFPVEGGWVALVCARGPDAEHNLDVDLWIGASPDLEHWSFRREPILAAGPTLLDTDLVYRSTGLLENGRLVIWFSARTIPGRWIVAVTSFEAALVDGLLAEAGAGTAAESR